MDVKLNKNIGATMKELNSFTEIGVPIIKELEKQTGIPEKELLKMITTGKIGFQYGNKTIIWPLLLIWKALRIFASLLCR